MQIELHGGTRSERENIAQHRDGILEGFKFVAQGLSNIYKKMPSTVLVTTVAAEVMSEYMALHADNKLSVETALQEMFIKGGELCYRDARGKVIMKYTILGILEKPRAKYVNKLNRWYAAYEDIIKLIRENQPPHFHAVSYSIMESIVIFVFDENSK